jgi:hypothetical protein
MLQLIVSRVAVWQQMAADHGESAMQIDTVQLTVSKVW